MYVMHNMCLLSCRQQHFIRLHVIQTLRKQCIQAENASSVCQTKIIHYFCIILLVMLAFTLFVIINNICRICVKSCNITLPCQSTCFLASGDVFAGSISFSLSTVHQGVSKCDLYSRQWCKSTLHSATLGGAQLQKISKSAMKDCLWLKGIKAIYGVKLFHIPINQS